MLSHGWWCWGSVWGGWCRRPHSGAGCRLVYAAVIRQPRLVFQLRNFLLPLLLLQRLTFLLLPKTRLFALLFMQSSLLFLLALLLTYALLFSSTKLLQLSPLLLLPLLLFLSALLLPLVSFVLLPTLVLPLALNPRLLLRFSLLTLLRLLLLLLLLSFLLVLSFLLPLARLLRLAQLFLPLMFLQLQLTQTQLLSFRGLGARYLSPRERHPLLQLQQLDSQTRRRQLLLKHWVVNRAPTTPKHCMREPLSDVDMLGARGPSTRKWVNSDKVESRRRG